MDKKEGNLSESFIQLDFDTERQYTGTLRLTSKLVDLRVGYAHTACGILPDEQKFVTIVSKRNGYYKEQCEWQYQIHALCA